MPIKPEKRHLYPPRKEWLAIRAEVLAREENACKNCRAENGVVGLHCVDGHFWSADDFKSGCIEKNGIEFNDKKDEVKKAFRIVLTIAHLDHDPTNNGIPGNRPNLAALCQRCHLKHDHAHHMKNARKTRARKKGQLSLLEE